MNVCAILLILLHRNEAQKHHRNDENSLVIYLQQITSKTIFIKNKREHVLFSNEQKMLGPMKENSIISVH